MAVVVAILVLETKELSISDKAVTSAVRLCECTVNDILGLEASVKVRKKDASITLKLPDALGATNESTCQALLTALMVYLSRLHEEYPDNISVLEV